MKFNSVQRNHTWELVPQSQYRQVIGLMWIFKIKYHDDGTLDKHKACLVSKGSSQVEGIDYEETFAPDFESLGQRNCLQVAQSLLGTGQSLV